ncbi:hypothetical protein [Pelagibius sp. 7325]|uniref:hypothetical protein n=1 Tax=Pelagibius sp. 7325 TaxID=3131994 RepID=UPI0030ECBAEB
MSRSWRLGWLLAGGLLLLSACASQPPQQAAEPSDPQLESSWRLARFALQNGQHDQAVVLYEQALALAYARDDAEAIGNVGYEYALAQLRAGEPEAAAAQAARTRWELERRDADPFAELFLVEAVAHYEVGQSALAREAAQTAIDLARPDDVATRGRAYFVLGMLAADAGDTVYVERALVALGDPGQDALKADRDELEGRRLMLAGDAGTAQRVFEAAADRRRELRDYGGMTRGLAAAGEAAEVARNPTAAADLYYRAGLSATIQDDPARAEIWLTKALDLAAENGLSGIEADARARLLSLAE